MINVELFNDVKEQHGCGYYNVCIEHTCICSLWGEEIDYDVYNGMTLNENYLNVEEQPEYESNLDWFLDNCNKIADYMKESAITLDEALEEMDYNEQEKSILRWNYDE